MHDNDTHESVDHILFSRITRGLYEPRLCRPPQPRLTASAGALLGADETGTLGAGTDARASRARAEGVMTRDGLGLFAAEGHDLPSPARGARFCLDFRGDDRGAIVGSTMGISVVSGGTTAEGMGVGIRSMSSTVAREPRELVDGGSLSTDEVSLEPGSGLASRDDRHRVASISSASSPSSFSDGFPNPSPCVALPTLRGSIDFRLMPGRGRDIARRSSWMSR